MDKDRDGIVSQDDFMEHCRTAGIQAPDLFWADFDRQGRGQITLEEFGAETGQAYLEFRQLLVRRFEHPRCGWNRLFEKGDDLRVYKQHFVAGCAALGYTQDAGRLFELLLPESGRLFLAYDDVWLDLDRSLFAPTANSRDSELPPLPSTVEVNRQ